MFCLQATGVKSSDITWSACLVELVAINSANRQNKQTNKKQTIAPKCRNRKTIGNKLNETHLGARTAMPDYRFGYIKSDRVIM